MGLLEWYEGASAWFFTTAMRRAFLVFFLMLFGIAVLGYGTYHIVANGSIPVPRKRGGALLILGEAAWIVYFGLVCVSFSMFACAAGLRSKGEAHLSYRRFRRWTLKAGAVMVGAGLVLNFLPR